MSLLTLVLLSAGPTEASDRPVKDTSAADDAACGLQPFPHLTKASVEALRYRGEDIARSITKAVVKEARAKELRLELLNSKRLKAFFEEHPGECYGSQLIVCLVCKEADAMNLPYRYHALLTSSI